MEYWGACLIGCEHFAEIDSALIIVAHYIIMQSLRCCFTMVDATWSTCKLGIKDTARVVPVHGVWWVICYLLQEAVMCNVLL